MNFLLRASRAILLTVALMSFAVSVAPVHAAPGVRANVTYQARLMDASGYPVADGVYQVEFSLYDAPVAGTRLWTADGTVGAPLPVNVTVQDGLFTVLLGDGVTQLPFGDINWNSDSLYLGVTIGADGEMSPRRPITAVPQAINSAQLGGMSPSSTDTYGGESQFTILQASTTAATSTRSALDVRSNGTSVANDFILRAITNAGSPAFTITSQGVVSTTNLLVSGQSVCLNDGTNCSSLTESDTLQEVVARGATTSIALTLFGGASTSELFVTSTLNVGGLVTSNLNPSVDLVQGLGSASLRWNGYFGTVTTTNLLATSLVGTSATFTNTTATNLFAVLVSSSQIIVNGQDVCLQDGSNCPAVAAEADTLSSVTGRGATSSVAVTFFGGVTSSNLNVSGTSNLATINASSVAISGGLTAATSSITGISWTNATGTNTTGTNAFFANLDGTTGSFNELYTASTTLGQATATTFFTQAFTATNAGITNVTTTNLAFTNASGASMIVTVLNSSTVNASTSNIGTATIGIANVTTGTIANLTFTNATGATLSISSVSATSLLVSGQNVCLANGTNCVSMNSTDTLAMVTARGATTSVAVTFFGGVTTTNFNATSALIDTLVSTNATTTNATSTNLFATNGVVTNVTSTNGFVTNLVASAVSSTNLFSSSIWGTNASFTNLLVGSQEVCLADGTNCTASAEADTLLTVTNRGSVATATLTLLGGFTTNNATVTSTLTVSGTVSSNLTPTTDLVSSLGTPALRWNGNFGTVTTTNLLATSLIGTSATFTNATATNLFASLVSSSQIIVNGQEVCLEDGTNCPPAGAEADTLASVTGRGATTAVSVTFFGGVTTSNLNATSALIDSLVWTNATGTNTTGTNAFFANLRGTTGSFNELYTASTTLGQATATTFFTQTFTATNAGIANATATNLAFTNASGASMIVTVLNAGTATVGTLTATTGTISSFTFTNATGSTLDVLSVSATNLLVTGQLVCLANGNNCLSATTTLQMAYDNGKDIVLNDGKIDLSPVIGSSDEFAITEFGMTVTPVLGAGYDGLASSGFDLSLLNGDTTGTLFTFTDNRADPGSSVNTSYLWHNESNNSLRLGNVSTVLEIGTDHFNLTEVTNGTQIASFNGRIGFTAVNDDDNFVPFVYSNFGTSASILSLTNLNGFNTVYLGSDVDPNGVYGASTSSDLLFRGGSTGGSGTQLYVNVDGTNTGWRGLATTDMLTGGSGSLQDAYDVGNQIVLNDGRVEIVGVTGTPDETVNDIAHLNQYGVSTTRLLSLANASKTVAGLEILSLYSNDGFGTVGTLFAFTDNRTDPFASTGTAYISHITNEFGNNELTMGNATSDIQFYTDSLYLNSGDLYVGLGYGMLDVSVNSDEGFGGAPVVFDDAGSLSAALIRMSNSYGQNNIVIADDQDPNGVFDGDGSDLLFRSGSSAGSGTQLYVNVDGSNTGWVGLATVDMLGAAFEEQPMLSVGDFDALPKTMSKANDVDGRTGIFNGIIFDLTNPYSPEAMFAVSSTDSIIKGSRLYTIDDDDTLNDSLKIYDITNPAAPQAIGDFDVGSMSAISDGRIAVDGTMVYFATVTSVQIFDAKDPSAIVELGSVAVSGTQRDASIAYNNGYLIYTGEVDYGALTATSTFEVFDVRDPSAPVSVSHLEYPAGQFLSSDGRQDSLVHVSDRRAYVFSRGPGPLVRVYDFADPANIVERTAIDTGDITIYDFNVLDSGLYIQTGGDDGSDPSFQYWDISDRNAPQLRATLNGVGNSLDYFVVEGGYAFGITGNEDLRILDLGGLKSRAATIASANLGQLTIGTRLTVRGQSDFQNGLTVNGVGVCLSDGTNCPVSGGGSLQASYDLGKDITLNNGHIELASVTGTNSDVYADNFSTTFTRMIGGGVAGVTTTGFDILGYDDGENKGIEFTFSTDRDGLNAPSGESYLTGVNTSRISFLTDKNDAQSLILRNNTSSINIASDYLYFSIDDGTLGVAHMSMDSDGLFGFEAQVNGGVNDSPAYSFLNGIDYGAMIGLFTDTERSTLWLIDDQDPNTLGFTPTAISDLMFRSNSSAGSGTQLYVNVDGTDTGWTGIATVDMLTGGSGDLQSAYDNGKIIVTSDGAIELIGSATATIVGTTDIPLITSSFVSGTNEGLDLALFSNSAVPLWSGTGTGMFYRHDQTIDVTNTTSSGLAFSDDGVQSYATLYTKQTGIGSFKYVTLDNSGIDISPGSGGTTTFMDNVALNSGARFDSSILPRFTNTFGLGSSSLRWNNFVQSLDIAGTVTGDLIPSANLTYDLGSLGAAWNEAFIDTITANTIGTAALTVGGQNVCLLDGTNCPVTSLSWVYDGTNGLVRLTTSSNDIVLGASATSTGAPVYLETNQTVGTSTLFIGYSTSANVIIGGTSSTMSHMHSLFSANFNGNDLYVGGNIGSASSVYTLGEFVVGTGSFKIGNGTLTKTDGAITVSASNGFFLPATDLGISLGSLTQRFNGYFNNVTSTNATTSNLVAGNVTVTSTLTASSVTMFGGISQTLSSSTQVTTEYSSALAFSGSTSVDLTVSGDTYFTVASTGTFPLRTRSIITGFSNGISASNVKNYSPSYADDSSSVSLKYDGSITLGSNTVYTTSTFDLTTSSVLYANGNMILVGDKTTIYTFTLQRGSSQSDAIAYVGQFLVSGTAQGIISIEDDTRSDGQFVISYYDAGATRLRRLTCNVGSACISAGSASNGISASPVEVRAMGGYYYAPIPETNSVVRFNNTGSWTTSTSYVMGDASARRIAAQNGYIAVVGQNLSVIDTKSNTRKTLEGVVGTTFSDVEMIGDTIVVVSNLGEYQYSLGGVRAPGAEFGSLTVGSASFDGDVYTKQSLKVGSGISVLQGGMDLQGGLTVGRGNAYISGSLDVNQHAFFGLESATDTVEYRTVISYSGGSFSSGLCLDDTQTIDSCPASGLFGTSLMADGTINASNFDLAEMYAVEGPAEAGDVLVFNQSATATVEMSGGTRYDRRIAGVVSTRPGLLLGWAAASQTQVALVGRVPTKVSMTNGEIKIGDPLTTSEYPGYAMKATKPGMILGYALEDLSVTGTIEVFVDTGYNAATALGTDGSIATVTDNLVIVGAEGATATTTAVGSFGLTFHGEGWDTTSSMALAYDFTLRTDMLSSTNSRFVIENNFGSSTFSVDQEGIVRANGYEVNDAFDLAERYESADQLEPGDLVMISKDADRQILRTNADEAIAIGVISTKAGFTLGANASGTFPVALAGRVPTKVTTMGGAIQRGDALMASTIPGVAQKATVAGQIIGYALENYEGDDNGLVEVFIQPGLWIPQTGLDAMANAPATGSGMGSGPARQGFAKVTTGGSRVSIKYTSILAYPVPQVTAMGNVSGGWWLENVSDVGFDIVMDTIQPIDIQFAWQVSPAQTGIMQYHSDGTYGQLDPLTGQLIENPEVDSEEPVIEAPVVEESAPEVITEGE